ncbi:MAG: hypothetical protein RL748_4186 [Pseudomonadota bacterium]
MHDLALWDLAPRNGHRKTAHGGAWQGFTTHISRFPDDKLAVVFNKAGKLDRLDLREE